MNQKKNRRNNKAQNKPKDKTKAKAPARIRATREYTAGGVVFRRIEDRTEILMIQDRMGRWTIPKGHVEEGESLEQTALREVAEETGLSHLRLGDKLDKLHFFYRREGKLIFMTTHVFLMEALGDTDNIVHEDSEGIVDAQWFDYEKALRLIEYRDTQTLFQLGFAKLHGLKEPKQAPRKPFPPKAKVARTPTSH